MWRCTDWIWGIAPGVTSITHEHGPYVASPDSAQFSLTLQGSHWFIYFHPQKRRKSYRSVILWIPPVWFDLWWETLSANSFEELDALTIFMSCSLFTCYVFGTAVADLKARLLSTLGKLASASDLWQGRNIREQPILSISGLLLNAEENFSIS